MANSSIQTNKQMSEPTEHCENCRREFPASKVHSHYAYCRRNIRKCRDCGEFIDINEEEEHIQLMHFRQPCQYCNRHFPKGEVDTHEQTCPSKSVNCEFCQLPVKLGGLDEHVSHCGTRTKLCAVCGRNIMLMDYSAHESECQRKESNKKSTYRNDINNNVPLVDIGNQNRNAPPPVPAKYRVERLTDDIPLKGRSQAPRYQQQQPEEDYGDMGFSQQDVQAQRAMFEQFEQQKRFARQRF